jgi:hypothetical protein
MKVPKEVAGGALGKILKDISSETSNSDKKGLSMDGLWNDPACGDEGVDALLYSQEDWTILCIPFCLSSEIARLLSNELAVSIFVYSYASSATHVIMGEYRDGSVLEAMTNEDYQIFLSENLMPARVAERLKGIADKDRVTEYIDSSGAFGVTGFADYIVGERDPKLEKFVHDLGVPQTNRPDSDERDMAADTAAQWIDMLPGIYFTFLTPFNLKRFGLPAEIGPGTDRIFFDEKAMKAIGKIQATKEPNPTFYNVQLY